MIAKIKTKSNYRQLNGTWLAVTEIVGKRVTCKVYMSEINKFNNVDFNLNEIEEFNTTIQIN